AEAIAARVAAAQADLTALGDGEAGTLRVGVFPSVGQRVLPELMRRYISSWPEVEVSLPESADDAHPLAHVERGRLHLPLADALLLAARERRHPALPFADLPLPKGPFVSIELLRDPYVLVVPTESEFAERGSPPTFREVAQQQLIGHKYCRTRLQIETAIRE